MKTYKIFLFNNKEVVRISNKLVKILKKKILDILSSEDKDFKSF